MVSRDVTNLRVLLGGGRKIIRHDCDSPDALEVAFTKDLNLPEMQLHSGLSTDNGATWNIVGPLGHDPVMRDRDQMIAFDGNLTHIIFTESDTLFWLRDSALCRQEFDDFGFFADTLQFSSAQIVFADPGIVYLSAYEWSQSTPMFNSSSDGGMTWSGWIDMGEILGTDGFDMAGIDGALMIDADDLFIAALAYIVLDETWAEANGFLGGVSYPAYTQSTDGGMTWADLRLVFGNDGLAYPQGHSGDPLFDATIHYIGGVQDAGYTSFNNCFDNVAVTFDGFAHIVMTMNDTTYGYTGIWHSFVDDGVISSSYVGFPEDPDLEGESGVAFMPSIATMDEGPAAGSVVAGWTEFIQGSGEGAGDICMNAIPPGSAYGTEPVNVTQSTDDETYQRIVDKLATVIPGEYYIDWLFLYYGEGGSAADSTLWHLRATINQPSHGIEDEDPLGSHIPRAISLRQNYPNPFNPMTTISFDIPGGDGEKQQVILNVYNIRGRRVATLLDGELEPGRHRITWDGTNEQSQPVSSGIYLYTLRTSEKTYTRKMVVLE